MGKIIYYILTAFSIFYPIRQVVAQTWIPLDGLKDINALTTEVLKSDQTGYQVKVTIHGLYDEKIVTEGGAFHRISMGLDGYTSKIGEPMLPLFSQLIAIPTGAKISAFFSNAKWKNLEIGKIYPFQKPLYGTEQAKGFDYDENAYQKDCTPSVINIGQNMLWRDITNTSIVVCPFKYYPLDNRLSVMTEFVLNVKYIYDKVQSNNSMLEPEDPLKLFDNLPYTESTLREKTNNPSLVRTTNSNNYDYLIIVGNGTGILNSDKLKEFQRWKALKGYKTKVVSTAITGTTETQIKNYITQEYSYGIKYVLFIGDYDQIPLKYFYTARDRYVYSDYWYGCLGGDNDLQAELPIGRFSTNSLSEFCNMVDKSIKYESSYNNSNEVLLIAHAEGAPAFYQGCCQQISDTFVQDMTFIPAYGSCEYGNNAKNAFVVEKINSGVHIVNYRGHGAPTFWGGEAGVPTTIWNDSGESFTANEINNMNNETCAVFFSIACQTGNVVGQTCMLETFTRSSHGAVAFLGATADTNNDTNHNYDKQLFTRLINESVFHLGDLNIRAHIANNQIPTIYSMDNPYCYLCGGDPSLELWTDQQSYINADVEIVNGNFTITTNLSGDYYVSIVSINGELLDIIACNSSTVTFPISNNTFYIAINKHNYFPRIIYFDSLSTSIVNMRFDYDAYYTATPLEIHTEATTYDEDEGTIVKKGSKLVIYKNSGGVIIHEDFECEKGATFEIK